MHRLTLVFLLLGLAMSSCTITEEITFRKGFSGSGSFSYNLALFGSEEEIDSTLQAQKAMAEEYKEAAKEIEGITNVSYRISEEEEESMMYITFDFENLDALNSLYQLEIFDEAPFLRKTFKRKGSKNLSVTWPVHALTEEDKAAYEDEMMDMYTHDLILSLPGDVKKSSIDSDRITPVTDQNKVYFKGNWGDFYTQSKPVTFKVSI